MPHAVYLYRILLMLRGQGVSAVKPDPYTKYGHATGMSPSTMRNQAAAEWSQP
jgi:hypothetical protein